MPRSNALRVGFAVVVIALLLGLQPRQVQGQNPWALLSGFHSVGISRVHDTGAILAVLFNAHDELLAMVVFSAVCDDHHCVANEPGAFLITDQEGRLVSFHVEPGREAFCHSVFASVLEGFFAA